MITLSTIVYEGNFDKVLSDDCWFMRFKSPLVSDKIIVVNNLTSKERFLEKINDIMIRHHFEIIYVNEFKDLAIEKYKLGINELTHGYNYTIPYFCLLETVKSKYILNVASDCMNDINITHTFLSKSIHELETNKFCLSSMVAWSKDNHNMINNVTVGQHENYETFIKLERKHRDSENFNYRFNFTDQLFMGDVERLKLVDYNTPEHISEQIYNGPTYGGNSFEKRMVGYQIQNNVCNCIYKGKDYYIHDNNYFK